MARNQHQANATPAAGASTKRTAHHKTRTGCKVCKARHLRCDEEKPWCRRCVSSGRKCGGYATSPAFPLLAATSSQPPPPPVSIRPSNPAADVALLRQQKSPDALRSYTFFKEVSAPSLAGALNAGFWLSEIPRVSEMDKAIWYAAVSLGAAHEAYLKGPSEGSPRNTRSLKYFNAAIRALTASDSRSEYWKALTASTIFTCICALEGELEQARFHFRSGCSLLSEIEREGAAYSSLEAQVGSALAPARPQVSPGPVSLSSIRSILIGFEMIEAKLDAKTTSRPPILRSANDGYVAWQSYTVPCAPPAFGRYLTAENLSIAARAAESLFITLVIASMVQVNRLRTLYAEGGFERLRSEAPYRDTESHTASFKHIERAIVLFGADLGACPRPSVAPAELMELRKAYLTLCVIHSTSRLLLRHDPESSKTGRRSDSLPFVCTNIVDLAEQVMSLESSVGCLRKGGPVAPVAIVNPLTFVVKVGFHIATRERAIRLLLKPRLEGLIDSRMPAQLAKVMVAREKASSAEYRNQPELDGITIDNPTARGWDGDGNDDEFIHPLARMCNYSMTYTAGRQATLVLRTWKEWLMGDPGVESHVSW